MIPRSAILRHDCSPVQWVAVAVVLLAVAVGVYIVSSDVNVRTASVESCERARKDRAANRYGWRIAQNARLTEASQTKVAAKRDNNQAAARKYGLLVADLGRRIDPPFSCNALRPKVRFMSIEFGPDVKPFKTLPLPPLVNPS